MSRQKISPTTICAPIPSSSPNCRRTSRRRTPILQNSSRVAPPRKSIVAASVTTRISPATTRSAASAINAEIYLLKALRGYKSGERKGYDPAMNEVGQEISHEDIRQIAQYVANFKRNLRERPLSDRRQRRQPVFQRFFELPTPINLARPD